MSNSPILTCGRWSSNIEAVTCNAPLRMSLMASSRSDEPSSSALPKYNGDCDLTGSKVFAWDGAKREIEAQLDSKTRRKPCSFCSLNGCRR